MELKCLSLYDMQKVRRWRNESLEMLRTSFPLTEEMQEDFYKNVVCNRQSNSKFWGIWMGSEFVGMCGLENIQFENRLTEISLLLNPDYSLDKYGKEALKLLLYEGFMNMNLENIYTEVYYCHKELSFWYDMIKKYKCMFSALPNRKYYNGKYYDSTYINFNKESFNESLASKSSQTLN